MLYQYSVLQYNPADHMSHLFRFVQTASDRKVSILFLLLSETRWWWRFRQMFRPSLGLESFSGENSQIQCNTNLCVSLDKFEWVRRQWTDQLLPPGMTGSVWRIYANLSRKVEFVLAKMWDLSLAFCHHFCILHFYWPDFDSLLSSSVEFTWFWQQA